MLNMTNIAEFLVALPSMIPWIVLLVVFVLSILFQVGLLALCWKLATGQHDLATLLAQALAKATPMQQPAAPQPAPAPLPSPAPAPIPLPAPIPVPHPPAPIPTGAFAAAPQWFHLALHEIGFHETGNNGGIERYIAMAHCGSLGDPWCAIFANAMLEQAGITGTRSPSSQSFRSNPGFVKLPGPALGAIVVYWRGSTASGLGHVGFYRGEDANSIWTLGGNENDMVQIEALPKSSASFGLIGYWWPTAVPLPTTGAVLMPTGSPIHVQVPPPDGAPATGPSPTAPAPSEPSGLQTNITATMFGGQKSAYGGAIDDTSPGVALPLLFKGARPRVRVIGKRTGVSIDCNIVDVGPWNINDPYWETGARPQAESGTDLGQVSSQPRRTNKAGIDLTLAAATALQIDGKGLVDWSFITDQSPNVT
jgi:uncharacterized protein (TIGR02594 family)